MSDDNYVVGFGRPPKSGRFKKGQSGNPKGRPKGKKSYQTIIDEVFRKKITITENGTQRKVAGIEALAMRVFQDAVKGNPKSTDQALKLLSTTREAIGLAEAQSDGTAPTHADDLATLKEFLQLYNIAPNTGNQEDEDDGPV